MTPSDYSEFRDRLGQSSGFQSWQYREIEFLAGNRNLAMLKAHEHRPEIVAELTAILAEPSLYQEAILLLRRRGLDVGEAALQAEAAEPHAECEALTNAWAEVYRDPAHHWDLYELAEKLIDFEDYLRRWRFNHVTTVERIIGLKRGTGGTSGVGYLKRMLEIELFPELWRVRTRMRAPLRRRRCEDPERREEDEATRGSQVSGGGSGMLPPRCARGRNDGAHDDQASMRSASAASLLSTHRAKSAGARAISTSWAPSSATSDKPREGELGGVGEGERRTRRGQRVCGLRDRGQALAPIEAMITVERGDEFDVWREGANIAARELEVGMAKRLGQARPAGRRGAGRVERPFGERLVDFAPDRSEAYPERARYLAVGIAGGDEVEAGFPALERLSRRAFAAACAFARWQREEGSSVMLDLRGRSFG